MFLVPVIHSKCPQICQKFLIQKKKKIKKLHSEDKRMKFVPIKIHHQNLRIIVTTVPYKIFKTV